MTVSIEYTLSYLLIEGVMVEIESDYRVRFVISYNSTRAPHGCTPWMYPILSVARDGVATEGFLWIRWKVLAYNWECCRHFL